MMQNIVSLFNRSSENAPTVVKLGKNNEMYFNKELKRWIEPGTEEEIRKEMQSVLAPPPKRVTPQVPSESSLDVSTSPIDQLCQVVNLYTIGPGAHRQSMPRPKVESILPGTCAVLSTSSIASYSSISLEESSATNVLPDQQSQKRLDVQATSPPPPTLPKDSSLNQEQDLPETQPKIDPFSDKVSSPYALQSGVQEEPILHVSLSLPVPESPSAVSPKEPPTCSEELNQTLPNVSPKKKPVSLGEDRPQVVETLFLKTTGFDNQTVSKEPKHHGPTRGIDPGHLPELNPGHIFTLHSSDSTAKDILPHQTLNETIVETLDHPNVTKTRAAPLTTQFKKHDESLRRETSQVTQWPMKEIIPGLVKKGQSPNKFLQHTRVTSPSTLFYQKTTHTNASNPPDSSANLSLNLPTLQSHHENNTVQTPPKPFTLLLRKDTTQAHEEPDENQNPMENETIIPDLNELNGCLDEAECLLENLEVQLINFSNSVPDQDASMDINLCTTEVETSVKKFNGLVDEMMESCEKYLGEMNDKIHAVIETFISSHQQSVSLCTTNQREETISDAVEEQEDIIFLVEQLGYDMQHLLDLIQQVSKNEKEHYLQLLRQHYIEKEEKMTECRQLHLDLMEVLSLLQNQNNSWRFFTESCLRSLNHRCQEKMLSYETKLATQEMKAEERLLLEQSEMERLTKEFENIRQNQKAREERLQNKLSETCKELREIKYKNIALHEEKEEVTSKLDLEKQQLKNNIAELHEKYEERLQSLKVTYNSLQLDYQQVQLELNKALEHTSSLTVELHNVKQDHENRLCLLTNQYEKETNQLCEKLKGMTSEKTLMEERCVELSDQLEKLRHEKDLTDCKDQEIILRNKQLETSFSKLETEKIELTSELKRLENQCNSLCTERMKLLSEIQIQSDNMGKEAQAFIQDKEKAVTSLKSQIDSLERQLSTVALEKDMAKHELEEYTREVSHRIKSMEETRNTNEKGLRQSLAELQDQYNTLVGECRTLKNLSVGLVHRLVLKKEESEKYKTDVTKEMNITSGKIKTLEATNKDVVSQNKTLIEECHLLRQQTHQIQTLSDSLHEEKLKTRVLEDILNDSLTTEYDIPPPTAPLPDKGISSQSTLKQDHSDQGLEMMPELYLARSTTQERELHEKLRKSEAQLSDVLLLLKKTQESLEVTTQKQHDSMFMLSHMACKWDLLLQHYPNISREIDAKIPPTNTFDFQE